MGAVPDLGVLTRHVGRVVRRHRFEMFLMGEGLGSGVELSRNHFVNWSFMSHANAALTPRARLKLARLIIDNHWPIRSGPAERYDVSWPTAKRWADPVPAGRRAGMCDGLRAHQASRTGPRNCWSERSCTCAGSSGWDRAIGDKIAMPSSTVHAVRSAAGSPPLTHRQGHR